MYLHVESKYRTYASLCYLYNIDIFQYVTKNSTFTRQITLHFIILVLITRYTLALGVHVCNKVIEMDSIQKARLAESVEHQI